MRGLYGVNRRTARSLAISVMRHLPVAAPLGIAVFGVVAMICLLAGQLRTWLVWPLGIVAAGWAIARVYKRTKRISRPGSVRERTWVDGLVVVLVAVWMLANLPFTAQHVFTNRDPATYNLTAGWLIDHHDLHIPVSGPDNVAGMPGVQAESLGFATDPDNPHQLDSQGVHLLPVLLAVGGRIVGFGGMLHLNVLFGGAALLAMYGFGRLIMRPRWAALATLAVSLSLPFIYFSRDAYTEPLAMAFIFTGLSLIYYAERLNRRSLWFLAGVVAGAASLVRIDSFLPLAAIELFAVTRLLYARPGEHRPLLRRVLLMALGAAIAGIAAWQDAARLSGSYYLALHTEIAQEFTLLYLLVIAVVMGLAVARYADLLALSQRLTTKWLARTLAWVLPLIFLVLLSRPAWYVGYQLQADGTLARSFSEQTMNWIWWYIGPLMTVVGIAGFTWLWTGLVRLKRTLYLPFMLVTTTLAALYLLRPNITGDQVWATRRFLPVVIPAFCLLAMLVFERLYKVKPFTFRSVRLRPETIVTVAVTIAVATPLVISYPFWIRRMYVPQLAQARAVCSKVPASALVLWLGDARHFAIQPVRTLCGNDSLGLSDTLTADPDTATVSLQHVAARTQQPVVVGLYDYQLNLLPPEDRANMKLVSSIDYAEIEHSYKRAPRNAYLTHQGIYLGMLDSRGHIRSLE